MSPHRVFCESAIIVCTFGGTIIGWYAGAQLSWPTSELVCAFIGMASCGAFADICVGRR